ncbi:Putative Zn-dependent hydrolases of the beta-lactamase fold [Gloeomargarita lithophora Alchichica-D10]|uniref:Zn-dependent hydrolases of the beta-lactamase fold n=1 Tax=Gloeomargarita lithophora Alchichica-D10 TaxID=1188229 RepID=A0A1J0ADM8_9CYAN|nr:MBL fold metallo-hydrolase [Gloeomargarita lithophora]APB34042.1 Putative Zn-dependent hydrolases of the beta-lactamase fold [Gloeomargarita lithophora Alchichica-D10]
MKRREMLIGAGVLVATGRVLAQGAPAGVTIQFLGHTCFLMTGGGLRILVNPFLPGGCTQGYRQPRVQADLVLVSSLLLDEGYVVDLPGDPRVLAVSGDYELANGFKVSGFQTNHDRLGGRRFGPNVCWRWTQAGIRFLHLGGTATPISVEQQILLGKPDVLFVPVGGKDKAFNPKEAAESVQALNPKVIIPTHYRTQAADATCDLFPLDDFLALMGSIPVRRVGEQVTIRPGDLPPQGQIIQVFSYNFATPAKPAQPAPKASPSPQPSPSPTPKPSPTATPQATPSPSPTPVPSPTPTPTPSPSPTPTPSIPIPR